MSSADICDSVASAVFKALRYGERSSENTVLVGLPDDEENLSEVRKVEATLKTLVIGLLAVSGAGVRIFYRLTYTT